MNYIKLICSVFFVSSRKTRVSLNQNNKQKTQEFLCNTFLYSSNAYFPKTKNQEEYVKILNDANKKLVVCTSPSGTGKTLFACDTAIKLLKKGSINKIVLTRPLVSVENEDIGFLPGNVNMKMNSWVEPMLDVFKEYYMKNEVVNMLEKEIIKISPLAYLRGKTFKNSFIICDEMQNSTPKQLQMVLTRIGDNSKMVLIGDLNQQDLILNPGMNSGLKDFINRYNFYFKNQIKNGNTNSSIAITSMTNDDILRSDVVKEILSVYDYDSRNDDCAFIPKSDFKIFNNYNQPL